MTYTEKLNHADEMVPRFREGLTWADYEKELQANKSLYPKDVADLSKKTMDALHRHEGKLIYNALEKSPATVTSGNMDPNLFNKLRSYQEDTLRADITNNIAKATANGMPFEMAVKKYQHPILRDEDVQKIIQRTEERMAGPVRNTGIGGGTVVGGLVIAFIIIRMILRYLANS